MAHAYVSLINIDNKAMITISLRYPQAESTVIIYAFLHFGSIWGGINVL